MAVLFTLTLSLTISGCVHFDGSYRGRVLELETEKPIEDAAVVAVWYLERYGGPAGPIAKLFDAKEAITDKKGEFEIPSIAGFYWWPFATLDKPNLIVFKPGYKSYDDQVNVHEGIIINLPKTRTVKERMESVSSLDVCGTMSDEKCRQKLPYMLNLRGKERKDLELIK